MTSRTQTPIKKTNNKEICQVPNTISFNKTNSEQANLSNVALTFSPEHYRALVRGDHDLELIQKSTTHNRNNFNFENFSLKEYSLNNQINNEVGRNKIMYGSSVTNKQLPIQEEVFERVPPGHNLTNINISMSSKGLQFNLLPLSKPLSTASLFRSNPTDLISKKVRLRTTTLKTTSQSSSIFSKPYPTSADFNPYIEPSNPIDLESGQNSSTGIPKPRYQRIKTKAGEEEKFVFLSIQSIKSLLPPLSLPPLSLPSQSISSIPVPTIRVSTCKTQSKYKTSTKSKQDKTRLKPLLYCSCGKTFK